MSYFQLGFYYIFGCFVLFLALLFWDWLASYLASHVSEMAKDESDTVNE